MNDAVFGDIAEQPCDAALRRTIRDRIEAAGTSFYWAMRLLPQDLCQIARTFERQRRSEPHQCSAVRELARDVEVAFRSQRPLQRSSEIIHNRPIAGEPSGCLGAVWRYGVVIRDPFEDHFGMAAARVVLERA